MRLPRPFRRPEPPEPDWFELASWRASLQHFDAVWAARFESMSARLAALEDPEHAAEIDRV